MPIYQFFCDDCFLPYDIMMNLKDLKEYDRGKEDIDCPKCEEPLRKIICPARLSSKRCTL